MHLDEAAPETIQVVVVILRRALVLFVAPGPCMGTAAKQAILAAFDYRYHPTCVGMEMCIDESGRLERREIFHE